MRDEELPNIGRVIIEERTRSLKPTTYYAVTEAIYGRLVHTAYFHVLVDAEEHVEATKLLMQVAYREA